MLPRLFVLTILLCFNVLLTGCGGPAVAAKDLRHPVRVTVTLDGKPLPDGTH